MNSIILPAPNWAWTEGPPPQPLVMRWQENLRQETRMWFRAGASTAEWLKAYSEVRLDVLRTVWAQMIPPDYQSRIEYVLLGSTARQEDVFDSDLDHALLFIDHFDRETVMPFLYRYIETMASLGYPPCQGFVMGTNERWSGTLSEWQRRVDEYFAFPDWENVRYLFMILDSRAASNPTTDRAAEWERLRQSVQERLRQAPYLCWEMAYLGIQHTVAKARRTPAVLRLGHGSINIKSGLLSPVVHSVRLLAVAHQVFELSTQSRLMELQRCGALDREMMRKIENCLLYGWRLRIRQHVDNPYTETASDEVPVYKMNKVEQQELMEHIDTAKNLERMILRRFRKPR